MLRNGRIWNVAFGLLTIGVLAGCQNEIGGDELLGKTQQAIGGESISSDQPTYAAGQQITATWAALPGNAHDWVALAPAGSPDSSFVQWSYTSGAANGSTMFSTSTAPGQYVLRAFENNGFTKLAESAAFTISAPVGTSTSTNKANYGTWESVTASYTGMSGNQHDWISIAPAGSPATTYLQWAYTNGAAAGSHQFPLTGLNGSYVIRAYFANGFTIAAESTPFSVSATTVSSDQAQYAFGAQVGVSYAGLPGNAQDWVGIARAGSPAQSIVQWQYTGGATNGAMTFSQLSNGTYVVRAFENNTFNMLAESSSFVVDAPTSNASLSSDQPTYTPAENATITWSAMPGFAGDWISIAPQGSPAGSYVRWAYTNGQAAGSHAFALQGLTGTFVARAHYNGQSEFSAESAPFTVALAGPTDGQPANGSYNFGDPITATFANLPGNQLDWVAFAPVGAPPEEFAWYAYTNGQINGSVSANTPADVLPPGNYVVRTFLNDGYVMQSESQPFTVGAYPGFSCTLSTDKAVYSGLESVAVTFSGASGAGSEWLGMARPYAAMGSPATFGSTGGGTAGTVMMSSLYAGTYVIRSFADSGYTITGQSASFTINTAVATDKADYTTGETIDLHYGGMMGVYYDWVGIAPENSAAGSINAYEYTYGAPNGHAMISTNGLTPGRYVARAFHNNGLTIKAESTVFTVH